MQHPLSLFKHCPKCGSNDFIINNEKSKKCLHCSFVYYFNVAAAVAAIITNNEGDLLVCRRAKKPQKGTLDLPGGFVDMNETAEEALIREVKEETTLVVTKYNYLFSLPNIYEYMGFLVHTMDLFYACEVEKTSCLKAFDDVAEAFFIKREKIAVDSFGLTSIQLGVGKWLNEVD